MSTHAMIRQCESVLTPGRHLVSRILQADLLRGAAISVGVTAALSAAPLPAMPLGTALRTHHALYTKRTQN